MTIHRDIYLITFNTWHFFNEHSIWDIYTSQQKKRYKDFFERYFYAKTKKLFIIIYLNVCVNKQYNILFPNGNIPESQFSVPMIEFAMIELDI